VTQHFAVSNKETPMWKRIGVFSFAFFVITGLAAARPAAANGRLFPDTISLPDGFQPEGIAIGFGATIYAGSTTTGAIFAASLVTGHGAVLVPPQPGRAATGLSFDPRTNLIYVAGGPTGAAYVYDARTGATVATYQLTTATATFINDQVVTPDAVYFTDSQRPVIYRVPLSRHARPAPDAAVTEIALGGDYVHVPGAFNANGIVASPSGRTLIIVHTALGLLYRVDAATGEARTIDLGGASVEAGDGLLLRGDQLFVVQNQLNQIAVIDLDRRFERGEVTQVLTASRLDVPTTIDSFLGQIYVVNARFGTPPTPDTSYTIEKVRRP
jgi:sugar lactone lactonase YvrE